MEQLKTLEGAKVFLNNIPEECKKNLIAAIESNANEERKSSCINFRQQILSKPYMQDNHKYVLNEITNNLVENNNQKELEQLNNWIDFTEKWWLIVHTSLWDIKFSPKQATFEDIKNIDGIEEGVNVLRENTTTGFKWLRGSPNAIKTIKNTGKRIFKTEEYLAIIEDVFSWLNNLYKCNKVFFDILWANQYGMLSLRDYKRRENITRCLSADDTDNWIVTVCDDTYDNWITKDAYGHYAGIRFIED